jgi:apolipoprotein N-acyltransferase
MAGVALYASFAPLDWWPLAVPAVAALTLAVRGRRVRAGLAVGLVAGLAEFLPLISWLNVVTPLAWLVLAIAEAVYLAILGGCLTLIVGRVAGWPVWSACLWVGEEYIRSRWPLGGFGWGRLAFSQPDTPFTGYAALGGAPLVTFAVALSGGLLALAVVRLLATKPARGRHSYPVAAGAVVAALVVPVAAFAVPRPTAGPTVQVAVVQGNVARPGTHYLGRAEQVLDNHLAETAKLAAEIADGLLPAPQVVLWPENSTDVDPIELPDVRSQVQAAAEAVHAPILVGAVLDGGPDHLTNTGVVWDPVTGPGQRYSKRHLVPFGEYIPFRGLVRHLTGLVSLVPKDFVPGQYAGALDIGPTRIADVMCFEVAFDGAVRSGVTDGGRFIVVQTNNATYMGTAQTRQQLQMSQLRAVEHGRAVVVAATSGISAVIAPDGHVVTRTGELTPALIDLPVPQRSQLTVADRLGAVPEQVLAILGVLAVLAALIRRVRTARRPATRSGTPGEGEA